MAQCSQVFEEVVGVLSICDYRIRKVWQVEEAHIDSSIEKCRGLKVLIYWAATGGIYSKRDRSQLIP